MKYCQNCGTQLDDNAYVCPTCGMRAEPVHAPVPTSTTNTFAIVGFILSFFMPLLGLIFSIIGLNKVKECNSGKGLAVAGIIISAVEWLIGIILVIAIVAGGIMIGSQGLFIATVTAI